MSMHTNVNGAVTELTKFPVSVNGAKTELSEMYQGTDGVKRLIFQSKQAPLMLCGHWMMMPNMTTATDRSLYSIDSYGHTAFKYNNGYLDSDNVYKLYGGTLSGSGQTWQAVSVDHTYLLSDYFGYSFTFDLANATRFQDYTFYIGTSTWMDDYNHPTDYIIVKTSGHGSTFQVLGSCYIALPSQIQTYYGSSIRCQIMPTAFGNTTSITFAYNRGHEVLTYDEYTGDPVYSYDFYECDFTIDTASMTLTNQSSVYLSGTEVSDLAFTPNLGNLLSLLSATTSGGVIGEYLNGYLSFGKLTSTNSYGDKFYTWFVCKINSTSSVTPYGTGITTRGVSVPPLIIGKGV